MFMGQDISIEESVKERWKFPVFKESIEIIQVTKGEMCLRQNSMTKVHSGPCARYYLPSWGIAEHQSVYPCKRWWYNVEVH